MIYYYSINDDTQRYPIEISFGSFSEMGEIVAKDYYSKHCKVKSTVYLAVSLYKSQTSSAFVTADIDIAMEPRFKTVSFVDIEYEREKSRKIVDFKDGDIVLVQATLGGKDIECKCKAKVERYGGPTFTIMEDCDGFKAGHAFMGSTRDVVEVIEGEA